MAVRIFQEQLSAYFKNACPDNKRLRVRIIQELCPDVTRIIMKSLMGIVWRNAVITMHEKNSCATISYFVSDVKYEIIKVL